MRPEHDPAKPSGWLCATDAADHAGVSRQRMHKLIHDGRVTARRWGKWWIVEADSVTEYAAEYGRPRRRGLRR